MRKIEIFDTTCRDGEQATKGFKQGLESKLVIARSLRDLGVSTIEAGFPISSPEDFRAVQQIAREIHGPYICALARCVKEDIDSAWEAIKENEKPTLHVFTFMVDPKSKEAYGIEEFGKIIESSARFVKYAKTLMGGKGRVEFSAQNATLGEPNEIYKMYSAVIKAGADVVNLPDTAGYSHPDEVFDFVSGFMKSVDGADRVIVSTHCHNDLGNATANSVAAVKAGATQVECTINGIGERAGNAALEEVVMNLITRKEKLNVEVSINTQLLGKISRLVSEHAKTPVQPNKPIVGLNAFSHSSGIHQDGVKKGAKYEIMSPASVGWDGESIEITSRSGKAGYQHRLGGLGYDLLRIDPYIEEIVKRGKQLSDERRDVLTNIDLRLLADEVISPVMRHIRYVSHKISSDKGKYAAELTLEIGGESVTKTAESEKGAVDALYSAVDSALGFKAPALVLFEPINTGREHWATAETTVILSENGFDKYIMGVNQPLYIGRARAKDTLAASVQAYVYALNRYLMNKTEFHQGLMSLGAIKK